MFFVVEFAKFPWWERGIATPGPGFDTHLGQYDLKKIVISDFHLRSQI